MSTSKSICTTCRDFAVNGHSETVLDMGLHMEIKIEVDNALPPGEFETDNLKVPFMNGVCDICKIEHDSLYIFFVTDSDDEK